MVLAKAMVQLSIAKPNCMDYTFSIHPLRVPQLRPLPMDKNPRDLPSNQMEPIDEEFEEEKILVKKVVTIKSGRIITIFYLERY